MVTSNDYISLKLGIILNGISSNLNNFYFSNNTLYKVYITEVFHFVLFKYIIHKKKLIFLSVWSSTHNRLLLFHIEQRDYNAHW